MGTAAAAIADPVATSERTKIKAHGVYYTPARLAGVLAAWALEKLPRRILEPSFGEGVFLRQARDQLLQLGVPAPAERLFGVELDPCGSDRVRDLGIDDAHLFQGDLLALDPDRLGERFEAILGNPPYIRHHLLPRQLIEKGRESAQKIGIELNGRSDAWAYFCAHLVTFLAPGGRLALVLPGSVLHADYAKPLLEALAREEGQVQLIRIRERLFPGVQERTVILLLDRAQPAGDAVVYRSIANVKGLKRALSRPPHRRSRAGRTLRETDDPRLPWRLTEQEASIWDELAATTEVLPLSSLATIRIGVVTGANSFFIRSLPEIEALDPRLRTVPIVTRGEWLRGPTWTEQDQKEVSGQSSRLLLPDPRRASLSPPIVAELQRAEEEELHLRSHCLRRTPWYVVADTAAPDLFLPYMASQPPRIVLNRAEATCTNAIHRVWLDQDLTHSKQAVAAASWTSLYRLSAELSGRSYGGGVLKLEPQGAKSLRLALTNEEEAFEEIADAYEDGGVEVARLVADRRILIEGVGMAKKEVSALAVAATRLAALRRS